MKNNIMLALIFSVMVCFASTAIAANHQRNNRDTLLETMNDTIMLADEVTETSSEATETAVASATTTTLRSVSSCAEVPAPLLVINSNTTWVSQLSLQVNICIDGATLTITSPSVVTTGSVYIINGGTLAVHGASIFAIYGSDGIDASGDSTIDVQSIGEYHAYLLVLNDVELNDSILYLRDGAYAGIYGSTGIVGYGDTVLEVTNGSYLQLLPSVNAAITMYEDTLLSIQDAFIDCYQVDANGLRKSRGYIISSGDVDIQNSEMQYFAYGIYKYGNGDVTIKNNTFLNNGVVSVFLYNIDASGINQIAVEDNIFALNNAISPETDSTSPYYIVGLNSCDTTADFSISGNEMVVDETIWQPQWGVAMIGTSSDTTISGNKWNAFHQWGIEIRKDSGAAGPVSITNHQGVYALQGAVSALTGHSLCQGGIKVDSYDNPFISDIEVNGPVPIGVMIEHANGATLQHSIIHNPQCGLSISDLQGGTFVDILIDEIITTGIYMSNGNNCAFNSITLDNSSASALQPDFGLDFLTTNGVSITNLKAYKLPIPVQVVDSDTVTIDNPIIQGLVSTDVNSLWNKDGAIAIGSSNNIQIFNLAATDIFTGLALSNVDTFTVINSDIKNIEGYVYFDDEVEMYNGGNGIVLSGSSDGVIKYGHIYKDAVYEKKAHAGVWLEDSNSYVDIVGLHIESMKYYGIFSKQSSSCKLLRNKITDTGEVTAGNECGSAGISLTETDNFEIEENNVSGADCGIELKTYTSVFPLQCNILDSVKIGATLLDVDVTIGGTLQTGNIISGTDFDVIHSYLNVYPCAVINAQNNYWGGGSPEYNIGNCSLASLSWSPYAPIPESLCQ